MYGKASTAAVYDQPLDWKTAWKALQVYSKKRGDCLKLSTHPNSSLTVPGLNAILHQWEVERDWKADVIIIDYADILAPENGRDESREATNKIWKRLRGLSQERHSLVITATQADAQSYSQATIGRNNFTEDKRKLAHVTGMIGINATDAEKVEGICRLNWIVLRENEFSEDTCVHVAGCLGIGQPAILSTF
jgi:replicative DNA helicase